MRLATIVTSSAIVLCALPASASAGTVAVTGSAITYQATGNAADSVNIGFEAGASFVVSERGIDNVPADCTLIDPTRVECPTRPGFVAFFLGFDDSLQTDLVPDGVTVEAHGGAGGDRLPGAGNADKLFGDDGNDTLAGRGGNDQLEGGPGDDGLDDGAGDDTILGGAGNDIWTAGLGRDTFAGGGGDDAADYRARTAPLSLTLNGLADDGEAGEGDNLAGDVGDVSAGSGNDVLAAGPVGMRLHGGAGDDLLFGGVGADRLEGQDGNDTIEARDGRDDSIDCGPGIDVVLADLADFTENCEITPDRDGDGVLNEADCQPDNPAVNPNAAEILGNAIDEDCRGGANGLPSAAAATLQIASGLTYRTTTRRGPRRVRFTSMRLSSLRAGDRVVITCRTKARGCPFARRTLTAKAGRPTESLVRFFGRRYLRGGAVVEVRVQRPLHVTRVLRLRVTTAGKVRYTRLCLPVGATAPAACASR